MISLIFFQKISWIFSNPDRQFGIYIEGSFLLQYSLKILNLLDSTTIISKILEFYMFFTSPWLDLASWWPPKIFGWLISQYETMNWGITEVLMISPNSRCWSVRFVVRYLLWPDESLVFSVVQLDQKDEKSIFFNHNK